MQSMQDFFAKTLGISLLSLYDSKWMTDPSYDTDFCRYVVKSPNGYCTCKNCHKVLEEKAKLTGKYVISKCHAGLTVFVVPIIVDGNYLGCTTGGHVLTEQLDDEHFIKLAEKFQISDEKFNDEIKKLRIFTFEKLESITDLLAILINLLFSVYYANFQLSKLGLNYKIPQNVALEEWFISKYQQTKKSISEREIEVLKLVVMGKTNPEIAKELFISTHTVKAHVSSILEKYKVEDRVTLAVKAVREGLV